MTENNYIGNISTIVKTACMIIAGYAIGYAVSIGLNLPITQEQLSETLFIILCFIGAYIDAKYPNTFNFLGNNNPVDMGTILGYPSEELVLNDEYVLEGDEN
ncbi:MAG: hypothetical protein Q4Q19_03370 [Methanobrevibacter sp.]|nr:hypothetical protein [Methanobrevibacter sp.]